MGSYANLWISDSPSPIDEAEVFEELLSKWEVPLGWLALFDPHDFILETVEEDGDSYQILYSSKPIDQAIENLESRSVLCAQAGGASWAQGKREFVGFLTSHRSAFVHVGYSGLMDDNFPAIEQRQTYIEGIKNIKAPVMIEKKSLFGKKKTVLAEHWTMLVPGDFKPGLTLPCWSWFGAPPSPQEDWVQ